MSALSILLLLAVVSVAAAGRIPFIIGGVEARIGAWPWQGSLQYAGSHTCGCVLISDEWVATAAHCVERQFPVLYEVVLGLHDQTDDTKGKPERYEISEMISHEFWRVFPDLSFDIAVLKLSRKVGNGNNFVKTVELAAADDNFDGQNCTITGWGVTTIGGGSVSQTLQEAAVKVLTKDECSTYWGADRINDGNICVFDEGQAGACNGDSGGPLVCPNGDSYKLAGLTSWGIRGCAPLYPSVYTRISYFRNWIKEKTGVY